MSIKGGAGMKKILIAEDEFLVRIGLKTTVDWEAHGYKIVGEASNGREAFELFKKTKPHILITDVKMPIIDGLELLSMVKEKDPDILVVILSNYDDFEYARRAMRLGASHYLLKNEINESNLLRTLSELDLGSNDRLSAKTNRKQEQEKYLHNYIYLFNEIEQKNNIDIPSDIFSDTEHIVLRLDANDIDNLEENNSKTIIRNIESIIYETIENAIVSSAFWANKILISVVAPNEEGSDNFLKEITQKSSLIIRNALHYFDIPINVGISEIVGGSNISDALVQAETARLLCFFTQDSIVNYTSEKEPLPDSEISIDRLHIEELFAKRNYAAIESYICDIFEKLTISKNFPNLDIVFIDLIYLAKNICEKEGIDTTGALSDVKFSYDNLATMSDVHQTRDYILNIYKSLIDNADGKKEHYSFTIRKCIEYIENNYMNNISLDDAAKEVDISRSYLSMLFKQETDINFVNYLTDFRIEQAKKIISSSNLKVYEVAYQTGFSSPYYFSKVFKDVVGVSCREYKETHS